MLFGEVEDRTAATTLTHMKQANVVLAVIYALRSQHRNFTALKSMISRFSLVDYTC